MEDEILKEYKNLLVQKRYSDNTLVVANYGKMEKWKNGKMENKKQSLKSLLDKEKETLRLKLGNDATKLYEDRIDELEKGGILSHVMKIGDMAPNFVLNNALGEPVELNEYLKKGKVVLTWYRGGWCPYCNLTLRKLQMELPNFKANGANLLTLTPELPDKSLEYI